MKPVRDAGDFYLFVASLSRIRAIITFSLNPVESFSPNLGILGNIGSAASGPVEVVRQLTP
jgi:hypothetical protein